MYGIELKLELFGIHKHANLTPWDLYTDFLFVDVSLSALEQNVSMCE
mgnify:CR=1 FL=1